MVCSIFVSVIFVLVSVHGTPTAVAEAVGRDLGVLHDHFSGSGGYREELDVLGSYVQVGTDYKFAIRQGCYISTVEWKLRLGNAMFQYAAGFGVAKQLGCAFCPTDEMRERLESYHLRILPGPSSCKAVLENEKPFMYNTGDYQRPQWDALKSLVSKHKHIRLEGYGQSLEYLTGYGEVLLRALSFDGAALHECEVLAKNPFPDRKLLTMHVRGGDYIYLGIEPHAQFYIDVARKEHMKSPICIHVVTNEPNWVKKNILTHLQKLSGCAQLIRGSSPTVDMCIAGQGNSIAVSGGTFSFFSWFFRKYSKVVTYFDPSQFRWDMYSGATGKAFLLNVTPASWIAWHQDGALPLFYPNVPTPSYHRDRSREFVKEESSQDEYEKHLEINTPPVTSSKLTITTKNENLQHDYVQLNQSWDNRIDFRWLLCGMFALLLTGFIARKWWPCRPSTNEYAARSVKVFNNMEDPERCQRRIVEGEDEDVWEESDVDEEVAEWHDMMMLRLGQRTKGRWCLQRKG